MTKYIILSILFLNALMTFGQTEQHQDILIADSTWQKEVLKMPLGFAPAITYEGIEDVRFAEGWSKKERSDFWTYVFAWYIEGIQKQTVENLETHLKSYFDGLMLPPNNDVQNIPEATALFIENQSDSSKFYGKIRTYDRFHTKNIITLYCSVQSYYCSAKNKTTVIFRFSIKPFKDKVWDKLQEVKISEGICLN